MYNIKFHLNISNFFSGRFKTLFRIEENVKRKEKIFTNTKITHCDIMKNIYLQYYLCFFFV